MRLIDEAALIEEAETGGWDTDTEELQVILKYVPTVDAVSVVRCSECRFRNTSWYDKRDMLESFCRWDRDESPNDDDYCSYGEKMESEGGT